MVVAPVAWAEADEVLAKAAADRPATDARVGVGNPP